MGWRFRKSFSPLPGVRLTLSPSGITTSVGIGPLRLSSGTRGSALSATVPGTGLTFRQPLSGSAAPPSTPLTPSVAPPPALPMVSSGASMREIRSEGSSTMTTAGLAEYKRLLERSQGELAQIGAELSQAVYAEQRDVAAYTRWRTGWLFRRLFKTKFAALAATAEESTARRVELEEQKQLAQLQTEIDMPVPVRQAFARVADDFSLLAQSAKLWDTVGARVANRVAERTTASRVIERKQVSFDLARCPLIAYDEGVPHLGNANGGEIFLYPAFVLYFVSERQFALLEYKELTTAFSTVKFIEQQGVPSDSKVVGHDWAKANKNGSPDLRFKDNYQIPVAEYGQIVLKSASGMHEEYMISNAEHTVRFGKAIESFRAALGAIAD